MTDEIEIPWDKAKKTKSQKQEERNSKFIGGALQINSGRSTWTSKRDNVLGSIYRFLVECRTTDKGSYSIQRKEFYDLKKQALQTPPGMLPMFQIDLQELSLAVIELSDWNEFQARMVDLEEQLKEKGDENYT